MPRELLNLSLDEVSAVDEPANKEARIVLMKRDSETDTKGGIMNPDQFIKSLAKYLGVEVEKEEDTMPDGNVAELTKRLERLEKRDRLTHTILKAQKAEDLDAIKQEVEEMEDDDLSEAMEAKRKSFESTERDSKHADFRKSLPETLHKAFDALDTEGKDEFIKRFNGDGADDPVAKALRESTERTERLEKELGELRTDAELRKVKEEIQDLSDFVKDFDGFASRIVKLRKVDPTSADETLADMRAMAKQAEAAGIFKVHGSDGEAEGSAEAELNKRVRKLRESDTDLSEAQAMTKVLAADPALYDRYNTEQEAR